MAQELIDKIQAQAQARGLDPAVAVRIAQIESSMNPSAKAKTSTAGGLFQVVDKTWKEYGGKPGQKNNPDENIRVGLNILEANTKSLRSALGRDPSPSELYAAHFLGAQGARTLLTASPDTPVEQLLSARAIKANSSMLQGKNAGELIGVFEQKMGMATPVAAKPTPAAPMPAAAAGAPKRVAEAPAAAPVVAAPKAADMGAGYQAALALSFLGDEEDKAEKGEDDSAAKMLAAYKPYNALKDFDLGPSVFAQMPVIAAQPQQPKMMADGGEVGDDAQLLAGAKEGAIKGRTYRDMLNYLAAREAVPDIQVGKLPLREEGLPAGEYRSSRWPVGSGTIMLSNDPEYRASMPKVGPGVLTHETVHAADRQMKQQFLAQRVQGNKFTDAYEKLVGPEGRNRTEFARQRGPEWASENRGYRANPQEIAAWGVESFVPRSFPDRAPLHVNASAATDFAVLMELAQRHAKAGPTGLARIPAFFSSLMKYADGGEVGEPTPEELEAASRPAFLTPKSGIGRKISTTPGQIEGAVLQGISETPYNLLGAPVDLTALAMRPFGYTNPSPMMGSEWIKQKMTEAGVRPKPPEQPTQRAAYELGQFGAGLVNPAAPVRGAVAAGQAGARAARDLMQDFQSYNRELAAPGASYAVKPKGGTFAYTYQGDSRQKVSNLDELITEYVEEAKTMANPDSQATIMEFLRAKAPKYFTNTYGTAEDPLRTAIRSLRVEPVGREAQKMPPYMIDAARNPQARGHAQAAADLERVYDELTGISGSIYRATGAPAVSGVGRSQEVRAALGREGVPAEARNPPPIDVIGQEEFTRYPHSSRMIREMVEGQDALPTQLQHALRTGETIYDVQPRFEMLSPANVIEALNYVPGNKLKNMSFPEALIQGMQAAAPLRDYKAAVEMAAKGAAVPREALMKFTKPVTPTVGGEWVQITEPIATKMEGKLMNHSVGGYAEGSTYGTAYTGLPVGGKQAFEEGLVQVYSLRDQTGKPAITVEVANKGSKEKPELTVTQIRGRFNSEPPTRVRGAVFDLLDKLDQSGNLKEIRPNSYSATPTGEQLPQGNMVDWGREYSNWKANFEE